MTPGAVRIFGVVLYLVAAVAFVLWLLAEADDAPAIRDDRDLFR